jgi:hypothetical protein
LESEEKRRGPMNSKGLAQLAYEKGMYILTAAPELSGCAGSRTTGTRISHVCLVEEGLKTSAADIDKDGQVLLVFFLRAWLNICELSADTVICSRKNSKSSVEAGHGQLDQDQVRHAADSGNERSDSAARVFLPGRDSRNKIPSSWRMSEGQPLNMRAANKHESNDVQRKTPASSGIRVLQTGERVPLRLKRKRLTRTHSHMLNQPPTQPPATGAYLARACSSARTSETPTTAKR